jgi:hypothetical protein
MSINYVIKFAEDFEERYLAYKDKILGKSQNLSTQKNTKEIDSDLISIQLKTGTLTINKNTGFISLNKAKDELNPESQELKTIVILATNKNYQATYAELLNNNVSKTTKRNLAFRIRNIKKSLGILPIKNSKNKDIFKNNKLYGYKLITSS